MDLREQLIVGCFRETVYIFSVAPVLVGWLRQFGNIVFSPLGFLLLSGRFPYIFIF